MAEATVSLYFGWTMYRPDQRTYRQQSIELYPRIPTNGANAGEGMQNFGTPPMIEVKIPLNGDYIANREAIITKQLSGELAPAPVLTISGVRYIANLFDDVFYNTEVAAKEEEAVKATDESWVEPNATEAPTADAAWGEDWDEGDHPNTVNGLTSVATGPDVDDEWAEANTTSTDVPWKEDWGN